MTFKFNFQACGCLLCFAMFQQFYKLKIQNSENSNNSLICFAAVPVCTLSFCNNSLTNFNTWAPAAPVPVLRPESVCADTKGWALGTEDQDSAPRMLALPPYRTTLYDAAVVSATTASATATLTTTDQGPVPGPAEPRLSRRYAYVCVRGHRANCSVPGPWFISAADMLISIVP